MEFSDSENEFCLTQVPSTSYCDINSNKYGEDISSGSDQQDIVSLETSEKPNFDVGYELSQQDKGTKVLYDNVEIEDITDESDVETM